MSFHFNDVEIDTKQYRITCAGLTVSVEPKVFDIIVYLIENRNRLVSRDELFEKIWDARAVSDTTLSNHIKSARKALGDDGEQQHTIKTVRGRGYQFIAEVSVAALIDEPIAASSSAPSERSAPVQSTNRFQPKATIAFLIFGCLCVLTLIGYLYNLSRTIEPQQPNLSPLNPTLSPPLHAQNTTIPYILVVPFSVSSGEQTKWEPFADQTTRELIQGLRKISGIRVVPPPSSFTFKANKVRAHIANQLPEVNYIIDGVVKEDGNGNFRISVELENITDNTIVWSNNYDIKVNENNQFKVQAEIAASVTASLQVEVLEAEKRTLAQVPTSSVEAYELYVQGQYQLAAMTHTSVLQAITLFSKAIEIDPKFEEAYIAKSDAFRTLMTWFAKPKDLLPKVITSSIDVIDINPNSARARSSLGLAYVHAWLWDDAWKMLNEAKHRDQSIALTELGFALYYSAIGEADELQAALDRADKIDPLNEEIAEWGMWALMMANELDAATKWGEAKLTLLPNTPYPNLSLAVAEYMKGNYSRSITLAEKGVAMSERAPLPLILLAQAYAAAGQTEKAHSLIQEAEAKNEYMCPYETAAIYALLEENEVVFPLLDQAVEYRSNCLIFLRHDPRFEPIRTDERYFNILKRVGLDDKAVLNYER